MEMEKFDAMFYGEKQAGWVVEKLLSYGIEAWQEGSRVNFITTWKRCCTLESLFAWWTGTINEWWFRLYPLWYTSIRNFCPGACVEALKFGTERPNIFAFNEEM